MGIYCKISKDMNVVILFDDEEKVIVAEEKLLNLAIDQQNLLR
jgi:hypothetical protein